ncbi:DUF969 domain-containing protein [Clostridium algidicarnis]|uniref:DUF969 domain-containing protein n=2 Tax=Clostridium algidicarnis TaxID=37659 RepID=A0ABS6C2I7_9CLOT|nr:DUF969 domain-containing protein [Clostridium algidicarnis]MBB6632287.1 DUF969 domain-containing protein [Clostridium algidicarnis]MBB6698309.1 DUF969 domain-containing protein [Clostridium algidicarnis]MBU3193619.1 DUF969 domain-containing protein [Clostridium algidicarnis]MBU3197518.1 DUF969 domain-containing protein [Clostridium algidicarnis]MBU3204938.1 DUF969 domain-containing protein [Clostridium algidicarnis]
MLKLIGILIVIIGFSLKLDTIAVVLISGVATGLVAKMGFINILNVLGKAFVDTRYMTLFVLTLPVIGICERYGLKEKAIDLIKKASGLTTGRLLSMYLFIREIAAALSLRLGGHPQFIRPLINPMAQGAAISKYGEIDEEDEDNIKAISAASENYGNFFGQNVFIASGGVLLIVGTLGELGYEATQLNVAKASIPIAIIAFIFASIQFLLTDKKLNKKYKSK